MNKYFYRSTKCDSYGSYGSFQRLKQIRPFDWKIATFDKARSKSVLRIQGSSVEWRGEKTWGLAQ